MAGMVGYEPVTDEQLMFDASARDMTKLINSKVFGPTCDGLDMVIDDVKLPDLEIGDWMVWPDMGSYTRAATTQFNGFTKNTQFYVCSDKSVNEALAAVAPSVGPSASKSGKSKKL